MTAQVYIWPIEPIPRHVNDIDVVEIEPLSAIDMVKAISPNIHYAKTLKEFIELATPYFV